MNVYRLSRARSAEAAFDGEGARRFGGRWNDRGTRVIYTSGAISLATLEIIVHLNPNVVMKEYLVYTYELDDHQIFTPEQLPEGWNSYPYRQANLDLGTEWAETQEHLALRVPSAIVPSEFNYILNPLHPAFDVGKIKRIEHQFDRRLLENLNQEW